MGNIFACCRQRQQLINLDSLSSLDPELLSSIEQLRKEHQQQIEQSYELYQGNAVFRGLLDHNKRRTGYGQFFRQGYIYLGDFSLDKPNGYGILIKSDQEYYRGEFRDGKYHGKGREFSQQHQFEGDYEDGQRRRGILRTGEFQYQGQFKNNMFDGHGHLQFASGSSYNGTFSEGKYHGRGFLSFQNTNKYQGGFEEGKYHGEGKFTWSDGITALCQYEHGQRKTRELFENQSLIKPNLLPSMIKINEEEHLGNQKKEWFQFCEIPKVVRGDGMLQL